MGSVDIIEPFLPMWSFFSVKGFTCISSHSSNWQPKDSITYHAVACGMVCETPLAQVLDKIMGKSITLVNNRWVE